MFAALALLGSLLCPPQDPAPELQFDDAPARVGEWGWRPADSAVLATSLRAFCWRPQKGAVRYRVQVATDRAFTDLVHDREDLTLPVWCRPSLPTGADLFWRVAFARTADGPFSQWSRVRRFHVYVEADNGVAGARAFDRPRILARVPAEHPRLFLRPEDVPELRQKAKGELAGHTAALVKRCERLLRKPPVTDEPPRYPKGTVRKSEAWRKIWWGNRTKTIAVLDNAAALAFTALITGREDFGALGKRLLLEASGWDPKGATGYRYNDEAGMPYAYHFARTYTLLHGQLTADERARCREVLRVRGREMYRHLCPNHLWRPFSSHSNRAWHFLGEVAIALHGEVEEADDWLWFAMNVFGACYPVWSGPEDDGGWHEGMAYWNSYLSRFTWWADVMKAATGVDAYRQSRFFESVGEWPLYVTPPGTRGSGFGDLCARRTSAHQAKLMALFARQAQNGLWQWYADQHGEAAAPNRNDWIEFVRGAAASVVPRAPDSLPTSRLFVGIGQAVLNSTLHSAKHNVGVAFKSSPYGTQSHGYESQNSFLLSAFGERLLIRSGRRDIYGSDHHTKWMWSTRSTNCVTLNGGEGQRGHSAAAVGKIVNFATEDECAWVDGEAAAAYDGKVESFRRGVLLLGSAGVVVFDRIRTKEPATFDAWLHAEQPFELGENTASLRVGGAACEIDWFSDRPLALRQTDRFDPPPRPRVKLVEHHLTASTIEPATEWVCITVIRPYRVDHTRPVTIESHGVVREGYERGLRLKTANGIVTVALSDAGDVHVTDETGSEFFVSAL